MITWYTGGPYWDGPMTASWCPLNQHPAPSSSAAWGGTINQLTLFAQASDRGEYSLLTVSSVLPVHLSQSACLRSEAESGIDAAVHTR